MSTMPIASVAGTQFMLPTRPSPPAAPLVHHSAGEHRLMRVLAWAGVGSAALALSPLVLPHVFSSSQGAADFAIASCTTGAASGWAASVAGFLGHAPLIGGTLAAGGLAAAAIAIGVAVGGMLLAKYMEKNAKEGAFPWARMVRWGSLATSMLIAAPMVLSGISMGLKYIGAWNVGGGDLSGHPINGFAQTMGSIGMGSAGELASSSAGLGIFHAVTCGLPLGLGAFLSSKTTQNAHAEHLAQPPLSQVMAISNQGRAVPAIQNRAYAT